jgi:hypothetical protein
MTVFFPFSIGYILMFIFRIHPKGYFVLVSFHSQGNDSGGGLLLHVHLSLCRWYRQKVGIVLIFNHEI